jgi:hypothetical protein
MRFGALLAGAALATSFGGAAYADTFNFDLATGNPAISGFPGDYASVIVDLTSSTMATITFTSLTNSGNIYLMGDGGTVGVNVNAASWSITNITTSNGGTGFSTSDPAHPPTNGGSGNEDGFGSFNQTINSFDGFTHSADTVSFTVTDTSGTWAGASQVLTPNNDGAFAEAHIFVTASPANASNGAVTTGYAANGGAVDAPAPEPASIMLLGVGLLGIGMVVRRRRNG